MIHRLPIFAALAALPSVAAADASVAAAAFGVRESISHVDLSPDGERIVFIEAGPGARSNVVIADLKGGTPKPIATSTGNPEHLDWCNFASNSQLVCRISGLVERAGVLVPFARLFTLSDQGTNARELGQTESSQDARLRQFDGSIIDWLPDDPAGAVLMSREYIPEVGTTGSRLGRTRDGLGVDRIDLKTLKASRVETPALLAASYISDGRGQVRIMSLDEVRGDQRMLTGKTIYHYRKSGSSAWNTFSEVKDGEDLTPIAIDATTDVAYALRKLNGRDALYRVKLDGSLSAELVYAHERVDVEDVVRVGKGARVIGVTFVEEERKTVYFDPEYQKLAATLSKSLPSLPLITFAGANKDGQKLLIFAGSDMDPGRYYLFDKSKKSLSELLLVRPALESVKLAQVKPVAYPVGDTSIPAYLTLPPGRDAKGLPAVVLPHGGPSARDEWGFDWLAQFLASQGYAVLQPNYRGSAGYGDLWLNQNGFRGWRTSIGDVIAGAKWMAAQGIADPNRLSIVGWSYGGYAALQAAVTEPALFKAVVAIAPVTDLNLLKQSADNYTNSRLVAAFVGSGPHLTEGSPLPNARLISAPVLMFHGDRDINVDIEQSRKMDKALRAGGKASELVVFPGLAHGLADSNARAQMLAKIAAFLAANGAQ